MSGYQGRRGPNVSQFLADLNTVPSSQQEIVEPSNPAEDFSLFTNGDFFDFDASTDAITGLNSPLDFSLDVADHSTTTQQASARATGVANVNASSDKMDFSNLNSDFQFADFSSFPNSIIDQPMQNLPRSQSASYPIPPTFTSPVSSSGSPVAPGFEHSNGKKRKLDSSGPSNQPSADEQVRHAAEEDKRRRNTAASARFRVKKKQREQALEKTAKEMGDRVNVLETRIQQLETENAWLKGLITEKNGGKASTSEIRAMLNKHEEGNKVRSTGIHTDGVGTKSEGNKA